MHEVLYYADTLVLLFYLVLGFILLLRFRPRFSSCSGRVVVLTSFLLVLQLKVYKLKIAYGWNRHYARSILDLFCAYAVFKINHVQVVYEKHVECLSNGSRDVFNFKLKFYDQIFKNILHVANRKYWWNCKTIFV